MLLKQGHLATPVTLPQTCDELYAWQSRRPASVRRRCPNFLMQPIVPVSAPQLSFPIRLQKQETGCLTGHIVAGDVADGQLQQTPSLRVAPCSTRAMAFWWKRAPVVIVDESSIRLYQQYGPGELDPYRQLISVSVLLMGFLYGLRIGSIYRLGLLVGEASLHLSMVFGLELATAHRIKRSSNLLLVSSN